MRKKLLFLRHFFAARHRRQCVRRDGRPNTWDV